jgi:hypothetical protein
VNTKDLAREPMTAGRFSALLEAYGANPDRWPSAERGTAEAYLAVNASNAVAGDAARLDALLDGAQPVAVSATLRAQILAAFDLVAARRRRALTTILGRTLRRFGNAVWPDAPLWQPATALAFSLLIGVGAGMVMPLESLLHDETDRGTSFAVDGPPAFSLEEDL